MEIKDPETSDRAKDVYIKNIVKLQWYCRMTTGRRAQHGPTLGFPMGSEAKSIHWCSQLQSPWERQRQSESWGVIGWKTAQQ
jgi:hypothetical protein